MMTYVLGMGALNEDVIYRIKYRKEKKLFQRIPKESRVRVFNHDEYSDMIDVELTVFGGSAANTITDLRRKGWKCTFIGEVGNDKEGKFIEKRMKKFDIKLLLKKTDGVTGSCGIILHKDGKYSVLFKEGVSDDIELTDELLKEARSCKLFHSSPFASFKSLVSLKTQVKLASEARASGAIVSTSPGRLYAESLENKKNSEKKELIIKLLKNSDVIFINNNESMIISGEKNYKKAAKKILNMFNPKILCITIGREGCYVETRHESFVTKRGVTKPVSTLGAGDAFAAGFLDAFLRKKNLRKCAEQGNEMAAKRVKFVDPEAYLKSV